MLICNTWVVLHVNRASLKTSGGHVPLVTIRTDIYALV